MKIKVEILPYDNSDINELLKQLCHFKLIMNYSVNGDSYGCIPKFLSHQKPHFRERPSTYPEPPKARPRHDLDTTQEVSRHDLGALIPDSLLLNASSSEEETPKEKNPSTEKSTQGNPTPEIKIPLKNGTEFIVKTDHIEELKDTYPDVDVLNELKRIRNWNKNNLKKRKTPSGIRDHIEKWIKEQQDLKGNQKAFKEAMGGKKGKGFMKDLKKEVGVETVNQKKKELRKQIDKLKAEKEEVSWKE